MMSRNKAQQAEKHPTEHDKVLEHMVWLLDRKALMPFLGAGVSSQAEYREPGSEESVPARKEGPYGERPHKEWVANLIKAVQQLCSKQPNGVASAVVAHMGKTARSAVGAPPSEVSEDTRNEHERWRERILDLESVLKLNGPARLAEIVAMVGGYRAVCEALQIEKFIGVQATDAHVAVACMMLEGLIDEVVTTNYDTCLEQAWVQIGGEIRDSEPRKPGDHKRPVLERIDSALGYVQGWGPRQREQGEEGVTPVTPTVYKLNGCAAAYRETLKNLTEGQPEQERDAAWEKAAQRIIVTERQLQTFRDERWAEDLFRDRIRRLHVVFSGFGSDEPQIRHTALAVAEEFSRYATARDGELHQRGDDPWLYRSAPYIQEFGTLSFNQTQLLWGYFSAWGHNARVPGAATFPTAITQAALKYYNREGNGGEPGGLTADLFWTGLLHAWWKRRFELEWRPGGETLGALIQTLPEELRRDPGVLVQEAERAASLSVFQGDGKEKCPRCDTILEMLSLKMESSGRARRDYLPFLRHRQHWGLALMIIGWLMTLGDKPVTATDVSTQGVRPPVNGYLWRGHIFVAHSGRTDTFETTEADRGFYRLVIVIPKSPGERAQPNQSGENVRVVGALEFLREAIRRLPFIPEPNSKNRCHLFQAMDLAVRWLGPSPSRDEALKGDKDRLKELRKEVKPT